MQSNKLRTALALGIGGCALVAGAACAFLGWRDGSQVLASAGVLLVLFAPSVAAALLLARDDAMARAGGTSVPDLAEFIDHADLQLKLVRFARGIILIATSFLVVLWFCQFSGVIQARKFLWLYTVSCALAAGTCLPWLSRREKPVRADRAACRARVAQLRFGG